MSARSIRPVTLTEFAYGGDDIITHLSWAVDAMTDSQEERNERAIRILAAIACFNSRDGRPTPEGIALARKFADTSKYELIGFCNMASYIKVRGSKAELETTYIHPMNEALLLFEKGSCCMVIASPGMRFSKSYLLEIEANNGHRAMLDSASGIRD